MQISDKLQSALQEIFPSDDPLDQADFDPIAYINQQFPNEHSLNNIQQLKQDLNEEYSKITDEISLLIREQAQMGDQARELLHDSKQKVEELSSCITQMREKAIASEQMVEEICQDIKSLDIAKKNLTLTMTALKKLGMLSHGIKQLANACNERNYTMAGALLDATQRLLDFFDDCIDIDTIKQLKKQRDGITQDLKMQLIDDFKDLENADPSIIRGACLTVDELGLQFRQNISNVVCAYFLNSYNTLFAYGEMYSGFEHIERRYAWLRRCLRDFQANYLEYFPPEWQLQAVLTREFCELTKQQVASMLDQGFTDTSAVVTALQKTIQFENDMTKRFAAQNAISIESESVELHDTLGGYDSQRYKRQEILQTPIPKFKDTVSIVFKPYLSKYCEVEEQNLRDLVDQLISQDSSNESNILQSSISLFASFKQKFQKCSSFNKGQTLFELGGVFAKVLKYYADRLGSNLPRLDKPVKLQPQDEINISFIINSCEQCRSTIGEMEATLNSNLDSNFEIYFTDEQYMFLDLTGRAIQALILSAEQKFDPIFTQMIKSNWVLDGVGDKSEYVSRLSEVLLQISDRISRSLNEEYYLTFLNKLVENFNAKFVSNVYRCKKISEYGAQQLLLDCYELKTRFLGLKPSDAGSYPTIVNRLFHRTENLLKVLSSSPDRLHDNYQDLIENPSKQDFERIATLMGLKKSDQFWEKLKSKNLWNFN